MRHLNYDDRLQIQKLLTVNESASQIASKIQKDRSTISREVKAYARTEGKPSRSKCKYTCIFTNRADCPVPNCTKRECSVACAQCAKYCKKYEPFICKKLTRFPFVCNGCDQRAVCPFEKHIYDAEYAHKEYKRHLSESRSGISLTDEELRHIEDTIIPLIRKGVSLPTAYEAYADSMPVSERTIYEYINKGYFGISNIDLRRKVRRKSTRQKSGPNLRVDKQCHIGRTYADFEKFVKEHPDLPVSEMDSVEGRKGGKVILTIFLRNCDVQLMFLRDSNTAATVTESFQKLRKAAGDDFHRIFPILLGDRGSEFTDPRAIEVNNETGEIEANVFYCDPQQTNQKSRCERNHEYIRYILPKGSSFDDLTQDDIDLVMNHVNSMPRPGLNGKAPVQVFLQLYGEDAASRLGLKFIPLDQLLLRPELLKK